MQRRGRPRGLHSPRNGLVNITARIPIALLLDIDAWLASDWAPNATRSDVIRHALKYVITANQTPTTK